MQRSRFQIVLASVLLALLAAVCLQQSPGWWRGALTKTEADDYLARISAQVPLPPQERDEALRRLRAFASADDGKPVYMLNAMRFFDKVKPLPGLNEFKGTPAEANAYYESVATGLLLRSGSYPVYGGNTKEQNLFGYDVNADHWSRILVVRYPSRRAFLDLLADPSYGPIAPYKLMSLDLLLVPTDAEIVVPDVRYLVGALCLVVFLAVGWWRSARRA